MTETVRRYFVTMRANPSTGGHSACMQESRSGMYVWFSDYDTLLRSHQELERELAEQARLNGAGASREAALMARVAELERRLAEANQRIEDLGYELLEARE